jgi:hypothetical protein
MDPKETLAATARVAGRTARLTIRLVAGVAGIVLMTGGLLLIDPYGQLAVGIPLVLAGLGCLLRAVF